MITIPLVRTPGVRIPLIAPPEARVYDLARVAEQVGMRIVHNPERGLEMVLDLRAGQVPVGRVA